MMSVSHFSEAICYDKKPPGTVQHFYLLTVPGGFYIHICYFSDTDFDLA